MWLTNKQPSTHEQTQLKPCLPKMIWPQNGAQCTGIEYIRPYKQTNTGLSANADYNHKKVQGLSRTKTKGALPEGWGWEDWAPVKSQAPLWELLSLQKKWHLQGSMESCHFWVPVVPLSPACHPLILKSLATPLAMFAHDDYGLKKVHSVW